MRGFTLVELLVALAVLLLVLLLAGQILLESQRMLLRTAAELEGGPTELAISLLESDLQSARSIANPRLLWTGAPLRLEGHPDGRLRWEVRDSRLERVLSDARDRDLERRVVVREVVTWRWRSIPPRLVDVALGVARTRAPRGPALLARGAGTRRELREESLRVALRGAGGRSW